ncbi:MAG: glutathione S-transferase family protein [Aestuariivirga sp.]
MASLIHFALDPFSRRIRLALAEHGVPADMIEEEPWDPSADIFSLNPAGTLPIYVENRDTVICGVEAIGEYIEETRNGGVRLLPDGALERAEVRRLVGWFDTKFYAEVSAPVIGEKIVRRFLGREAGGGAPDMGRVRTALAKLRQHLDYIGQLADRRAWLAGETLTLADLAAAAHVSVIDYFGDVPWAEYPSAKPWYQRIKSRPSFRPLLGDSVRGLTPSAAYADLDF